MNNPDYCKRCRFKTHKNNRKTDSRDFFCIEANDYIRVLHCCPLSGYSGKSAQKQEISDGKVLKCDSYGTKR